MNNLYGIIYDESGHIVQRMSDGIGGAVQLTADSLGMQYIMVPDDAAYEKTHHVVDGKLVENSNGE